MGLMISKAIIDRTERTARSQRQSAAALQVPLRPDSIGIEDDGQAVVPREAAHDWRAVVWDAHRRTGPIMLNRVAIAGTGLFLAWLAAQIDEDAAEAYTLASTFRTATTGAGVALLWVINSKIGHVLGQHRTGDAQTDQARANAKAIQAGKSIQHACVLVVPVASIAVALQIASKFILFDPVGVDEAISKKVFDFFVVNSWANFPGLWFMAGVNFLMSLPEPQPWSVFIAQATQAVISMSLAYTLAKTTNMGIQALAAPSLISGTVALADLIKYLKRDDFAKYRLFDFTDTQDALKAGAAELFKLGVPFLLRTVAIQMDTFFLTFGVKALDSHKDTNKAAALVAPMQLYLLVIMVSPGFTKPLRALLSKVTGQANDAFLADSQDLGAYIGYLRQGRFNANIYPLQGLGYTLLPIIVNISLGTALLKQFTASEYRDDAEVMSAAFTANVLLQINAGLDVMLSALSSNLQSFQGAIQYLPATANTLLVVVLGDSIGFACVSQQDGYGLEGLLVPHMLCTGTAVAYLWYRQNRHYKELINSPKQLLGASSTAESRSRAVELMPHRTRLGLHPPTQPLMESVGATTTKGASSTQEFRT